jgi:hypothetical protein
MAAGHMQVENLSGGKIDGHRLAEFVYGTVTGMVAIAGVGGNENATWFSAGSIIIVGALAIWIAHAYSILLSHRFVTGEPLNRRQVGETLAGSWPIVIAGILLTLPLLPVAVGLWGLGFGLVTSSVLGVLILGLVGFLAGVVTHEPWYLRLLAAIGSAAIGLIIIAVEYAVHH